MENLMAKAMTERYEDYFNTEDSKERATKNIYYWLMSTIESIFWGFDRNATIYAQLYATEEKIVFIFRDVRGEMYQYVYYPTYYKYSMQTVLNEICSRINNIQYPLPRGISIVVQMNYYDKVKEGKFRGKYYAELFVDMLKKV